MKSRVSASVIIVLLLVSVSCEQKKASKPVTENKKKKEAIVNGVQKSTYSDGKVRTEIPYKDSKKHGQAKEYYQSGKVFQAIDYANGHKHGYARRYHEAGGLYQETPYDSGEIHGVQMKYRQDGKVASEMRYNHGNPCVGLKEYTTSGKLKEKYPSIVIKAEDNILKESTYSLIISMSDKVKSVEYFDGRLTDGKCLGDLAKPICCADRYGVLEMHFPVYPGQFLMKELNIIAKVRTTQDNYYLVQRKYNLAVENRF